MSRLLLSCLLIAATFAASAPAEAACPDSGSPSVEVCEYWNLLLMPALTSTVYLPGDAGGPWFGAGVEVALLTWADNGPGRGPSQGRVFLDIGGLGSAEDGTGAMFLFRAGASLSFEGNASRTWLIPYYGAAIGGLDEKNIDFAGFVEAQGGLHLWYTPQVVVDVEGGYLLPFSQVDRLSGPRAQLTAAVAWW
ncbi:hypothetical protein [Haliangium sp.]|uniref:hypothetical protein n=1 Tax=Haliangium sp. TaxID=2663208 RepID=UPI003D0F0290